MVYQLISIKTISTNTRIKVVAGAVDDIRPVLGGLTGLLCLAELTDNLVVGLALGANITVSDQAVRV